MNARYGGATLQDAGCSRADAGVDETGEQDAARVHARADGDSAKKRTPRELGESNVQGTCERLFDGMLGTEVKDRFQLKRFAGMSLHATWVLAAFYSAVLYGTASDFRAAMYVNMFVSLAFLAVTSLVAARFLKNGDKLVLSKHMTIGASVPLALATFLLYFGSLESPQEVALVVASGIVTGVCSAVLFLGWYRLYTDAGTRVAIVELSGAWTIAALTTIVLCFLPALVSAVAVSVMALCGGILLRASSFHRPERPAPRQEHQLHARTKRMFARAAAASCGIGAVAGFSDVLAGFRFLAIPDEYGVLLLAGGAFGTVLALGVGMMARANAVTYLYRLALLAMMFGGLGIPFMQDWLSIPGIMIFGGYQVFLVALVVVCGDVSNYFDVPAVKVIGLALGALYSGELLGAALAHGLTLCAPRPESLQIVAFVLTGLLIIVNQFLFSEKDLVETHIGELVDSEPDPEPDRAAMSADEEAALVAGVIADAHGLSARERDVLPLLIKGRTIARIQEELYISQGTVSTHIRHIYQKTGVHNRQALLDLIEETRAKLAEDS